MSHLKSLKLELELTTDELIDLAFNNYGADANLMTMIKNIKDKNSKDYKVETEKQETGLKIIITNL